MLAAVRKIKESKASTSGADSSPVIVDLHPNRPNYRGVKTPFGSFSLEADPSFAEVEEAGGRVEKHDEAHEVLDSHFLISGEIPRLTEYEHGIRNGVRFEGGEWVTDELIMDERLVVCHVKGMWFQLLMILCVASPFIPQNIVILLTLTL